MQDHLVKTEKGQGIRDMAGIFFMAILFYAICVLVAAVVGVLMLGASSLFNLFF